MTTGAMMPARRLRPWRLTVEQYLKMGEAGILSEKDRVFLWKGRLVEKMTKARPHVITEGALNLALTRIVPAGWSLEREAPVVLTQRSDTLPEPDFKVVRGRPLDYRDTPTTRDVSLVIEVSDSSLRHDRGSVLSLYGAESVPLYWVANVPDRQVEVYSDPTGPATPSGYGLCAIYRPGAEVPVVLDGVEVGRIAVDEIFPAGGPRA